MFTLISCKISSCIRLQDPIKFKCSENRMNKPYSKKKCLKNYSFADSVLDQAVYSHTHCKINVKHNFNRLPDNSFLIKGAGVARLS